MNIRPAVEADLPAILQIYNQAVLTTTATYDYEARALDDQRTWFEEHQRGSYPVLVAESDSGRVVGWSSLSEYHPRPGYRFTVEDSIYVSESERGRGIGKLLLGPLVGMAAEMGMRAIIASIDQNSLASIRLHAGFGFTEVGRFPQVGFKFGNWLDVIYMERLLID